MADIDDGLESGARRTYGVAVLEIETGDAVCMMVAVHSLVAYV